MNEEETFKLAEKLADEAYGDKGVYLYSERQDLTIRLNNILQSEFKNLPQAFVSPSVPYQICPKCGGDGDLLRYNSPALMGTNARPICDVCEGKKIISMTHFG